MPDSALHSMLGMRLTADNSPSGFVAVAVGYSGDISSADFAVLRSDDFSTNEVTSSSAWSDRRAALNIATAIPTESGLRLIGTRYSTFDGRRVFTLDLDAAGNYAEPLPLLEP